MATRRTNLPATSPSSSANLAPDAGKGSSGGASEIAPAVPSSIIAKLLGFTVAMITLPLSSYFATVNNVFGGNSTYAGALAAVVANVVLIGYVIVAFNDDKLEREAELAERKKER